MARTRALRATNMGTLRYTVYFCGVGREQGDVSLARDVLTLYAFMNSNILLRDCS